MKKILICALLLLASCKGSHEKVIPSARQEFNGRDELISYGQMVRRPVYQAQVPLGWKRIDPEAQETNLDTTKPIVSFEIEDQIVLTVHNFPSESLEERVPLEAQVQRWQKQLPGIESVVENVAHGGFYGLYLEGKTSELTLAAFAFQLDLEHYQTLHFFAGTVEEEEHYKQMSADFTIKVCGPCAMIERHREEIRLFANTFELIQEIPTRI